MADQHTPREQLSWELIDAYHTGVTVSDIDRSIEFYRDLLGMTLVHVQEGQRPYLAVITGFSDVYLRTAFLKANPAASHVLELLEYRSHPGQVRDPATNQPGSGHLCLSVKGIVQIHATLSARGATFVSAPEPITSGINQGAMGCYLRDPDGFTIELFEKRS